ncbi:hypothetical protein TWF694_005982 [Orbilia ellipsospora]|uniref:Uncharacterized protein n=1 Tax=Orbilia ellipsospora TaxID=2528407 RepID=A0AAV9WRR7_9PEZI
MEPSATTDSSAIQTYKNEVDNYVKNGLNLSTNAKIGIGVGASIIALGVIGMVIFIVVTQCRSKKLGENEEGGMSSDDLSEEEKAAEARRMEALNNM